MKGILTVLSSLILLVDCAIYNKISFKPYSRTVKYQYYEYEDWTHGEVPWDVAFEDPGTNKVLKSSENSMIYIREKTTRDKIWEYLEREHWKLNAGMSGALKGMYIQLGTGDSIVNELDNFENCSGCSEVQKKISEINNHNTEFEFLMSATIFIYYNIYKKNETEYLINAENIVDIAYYMEIRKRAVMFILVSMLIFTKNIKGVV